MANYHYKIKKYLGKNDGQCEEQMQNKFSFWRCPRKVKEKIDEASLCKIHANSLKKWRSI